MRERTEQEVWLGGAKNRSNRRKGTTSVGTILYCVLDQPVPVGILQDINGGRR